MPFAKLSAIAVAAAFLISPACAPRSQPAREWGMGENVALGPLTYHVIETEWKSQLGDFPDTRAPERKFLLVHMTVTNSGGSAITIPPFAMVNADGQEFTESLDGTKVPKWLGIVRSLAPGDTEEGRILFDLPANGYRLRMTDGSGNENERTAFVQIPFTFETGLDPAAK